MERKKGTKSTPNICCFGIGQGAWGGINCMAKDRCRLHTRFHQSSALCGQLAPKFTLVPPQCAWRVENRVTSIAGWGCRRDNSLLPLRPAVAGGVSCLRKLGTREGVSSVLANPRVSAPTEDLRSLPIVCRRVRQSERASLEEPRSSRRLDWGDGQTSGSSSCRQRSRRVSHFCLASTTMKMKSILVASPADAGWLLAGLMS